MRVKRASLFDLLLWDSNPAYRKIIWSLTTPSYLVWLDKKPVIHVIDEHTRFRNACFVKSKEATDIWNAFVGCWVSTYVGFPSKIKSDLESAVTSDAFRQISSTHGITLELSGVSAHNGMGKVESAHGPLRRIYGILSKNHKALSNNLSFRLAVKALNNTSGPNGLVPSLFVDPINGKHWL